MKHHLLHRCIPQGDVRRCGVAWRGTAGGLGVVRCTEDFVGSARQVFRSASAFNQNIGSWNTASVTTMFYVRALVPSPACGAHPKIFVQQWSRPQVVPAQMWGWPTSDVGESRRRCGRRPGADVGEVWLTCERVLCFLSMNVTCWRVATRLCDEAPLVASLYEYTATRCMALRPGAEAPARCAWFALRCGWRGVGSAGVYKGVGVQPEHRQLEHRVRDDHVPGMRPCAVARKRRATDLLVAAVVPAPSGPGADVGMAHLGCGRVAVQMWASPGAGSGPRCGSTVNESGVFCL
jgi:surface protein